jgi:hypothetical protein
MFEKLQEIAAREDKPWAAARAARAIVLTEQFQSGGIDRNAYEEELRTMTDPATIEAESDDFSLKTALVVAIWVACQATHS